MFTARWRWRVNQRGCISLRLLFSLPYPPLVHPTLYHIIELRTPSASSSSSYGFSFFATVSFSNAFLPRPDRRTFSTIDITNPSRPFSIPTFTTLRRINGLYLTAFGNGWLRGCIYIYIYVQRPGNSSTRPGYKRINAPIGKSTISIATHPLIPRSVSAWMARFRPTTRTIFHLLVYCFLCKLSYQIGEQFEYFDLDHYAVTYENICGIKEEILISRLILFLLLFSFFSAASIHTRDFWSVLPSKFDFSPFYHANTA